jgi:hypothetical protein
VPEIPGGQCRFFGRKAGGSRHPGQIREYRSDEMSESYYKILKRSRYIAEIMFGNYQTMNAFRRKEVGVWK